MRLPRWSSFQRKLAFYFCIAVSVVTVLMSGISNILFSRNYRNAIERQNTILLAQLASQIEHQIFNPVTSLSIDILNDSTVYPECTALFNSPYTNRHINIKASYDNIRSAVSRHSDIIQAIDLYYANSGLVVSSYAGMHIVGGEGDAYRGLWEPITSQWTTVRRWEYRGMNPRLGEGITYIISYPNNTAYPKGYASVQVNPQALSGIFSEYNTEDTSFYVLSSTGRMVYGDSDLFYSALTREDALSAVELAGGTPAILPVSRNGDVVLSGIALNYSGFVVLSVTSTERFYRVANDIQLLLLAISAGVFLVGLVLSGVFSVRLYRPMK
ncbi:hypothetical protein LJC63_03240 [Ruminococcaceae bacterium OttesenSCG-928-L11]|nr:hypothetical protein [Ruminococcaceae bacterium OttesenSCG-928-L11]